MLMIVFHAINELFKKILAILSYFLFTLSTILFNLSFAFLFFCIFHLFSHYMLKFILEKLCIYIKSIYQTKNLFFIRIININVSIYNSLMIITNFFAMKLRSLGIIINDLSQNRVINYLSDKLYFWFQYLYYKLSSKFTWFYSEYNIVFSMLDFIIEKSIETITICSDDIDSFILYIKNLNITSGHWYLEESS